MLQYRKKSKVIVSTANRIYYWYIIYNIAHQLFFLNLLSFDDIFHFIFQIITILQKR